MSVVTLSHWSLLQLLHNMLCASHQASISDCWLYAWWVVIHFCSALITPLCQPISACFYIWPLSRAFSCYCSSWVHVAYRGKTGTDMHKNTSSLPRIPFPRTYARMPYALTPQCLYLFSLACSIFLSPPPAERWGLLTAGGYSCWLSKWARAGS